MRLTTLTAVVVVGSLSLVGCGSDSGGITKSKAPATTSSSSSKSSASGSDEAAIVAFFTDGGDEMVTEDEAACMAKGLDLSDEGMTTIRDNSGGDLTAFSKSDAAAIVKAIDDCVDFDRMAEALGATITASSGLKISDDDATCAAKAMASNYEGPGEFMQDFTSMQQEDVAGMMLEALGGCLSEDSATALVADLLIKQGQTEEASNCVARKLVTSMGAGPLLKAFVESGKGSVDQDLATQMATGMIACGVDPTAGGSSDGSGSTGSGSTDSGSVGGGLSGN